MSQLVIGGIKHLYDLINSMKPVATDWITAPDMEGEGTSTIMSAEMRHSLHSVLSETIAQMPLIEVRFVPDGASAWVRIVDAAVTAVSRGVRADDFYSTPATSWLGERRVYVQLPRLEGEGSTSVLNRLRIHVEARGSSEASVFQVTGIRSRLIYTPVINGGS